MSGLAATLVDANGAVVAPALDTSLQQILATLKGQTDIASTLWTDNTGAYFVRRDLVNEGTGAITIAWSDLAGNAVSAPGAGAKPAAGSASRQVIQTLYDVTGASTGYATGDSVARIVLLDTSQTPVAVLSATWLNLSQGTVSATAPTTFVEASQDLPVGAAKDATLQSVIAAIQAATPAGTNLIGSVTLGTGTNSVGAITNLFALDATITARLGTLGQKAMAGSAPVVVASDQGAIPVSAALNGGTATVFLAAGSQAIGSLVASSTGLSGATYAPYYVTATAAAGQVIKGNPGNVFQITAWNTDTQPAFLKLFNKASAPTMGTDSAVWEAMVPAGGSISVSFADVGLSFGTGIAVGFSGAQGAKDATALNAANKAGVSLAVK